MPNTFRKDYGSNGWTIQSTEQHAEGATVSVSLKSGATKPVKLGRLVGFIYEVDDSEERRARRARTGNVRSWNYDQPEYDPNPRRDYDQRDGQGNPID